MSLGNLSIFGICACESNKPWEQLPHRQNTKKIKMAIGFPILILVNLILFFWLKKLLSITKTRRWIFWTVITLLGFLFLFGANEFSKRTIRGLAGNYPFVEFWDIQASEREVIDAIRQLNKVDPNFNPPGNIAFISKRDTGYNWTSYQMQAYIKKVKIDSLTPLPEINDDNYYHDYWLHVKLYYPDTKEIIYTWTRPKFDTTVTTFAFESLSKIDNPTKFRLINRDFWFIDNRRQINKFKQLIVDKIQAQIDLKRKSGS